MRWPCCSEAAHGDSGTIEATGAMGVILNRLPGQSCPELWARRAQETAFEPQGSTATAQPSGAHTHLVYQDQGILGLGLLQALYDLSRHGAHVCPPGKEGMLGGQCLPHPLGAT